MISRFRDWSERFLADREMVLVMSFLVIATVLLITMGRILAPVLASVVIAYLLQSPVRWLQHLHLPRLWAVSVVYCAFLGLFFVAMLILWPLVFQQLIRLYAELPKMITEFQHFLISLPQQYPDFITKTTVDGWIDGFVVQLRDAGKIAFAASLATLPSVMAMIVYLFLVPLMVFFFLKDYRAILQWMAGFLPQQHALLQKVWIDIDSQIMNYIRGKIIEVSLLAVATYVVFYGFHLPYAFLLAVIVGISVFIPYIGIVVVTIPVVLVGFFTWGLAPHFAYFLLAYGLLQAFDGAILTPLLFGEVVNLHPIAIIVAILVFGAWWGFWGVFFAIPLATVVKVMSDLWLDESRQDSTIGFERSV